MEPLHKCHWKTLLGCEGNYPKSEQNQQQKKILVHVHVLVCGSV